MLFFFSLLVPTPVSRTDATLQPLRITGYTPQITLRRRAVHQSAKQWAMWRTDSLGRGARMSLLDVFQMVLLRSLFQGRRQQRDLAGSSAQNSVTASRCRTAASQLRLAAVRREYRLRAWFMLPRARHNGPRPPVLPSGLVALGRVRLRSSKLARHPRLLESTPAWSDLASDEKFWTKALVQ